MAGPAADDLGFREAGLKDLPAIVAMLHEDAIGETGASHDPAAYRAQFEALAADPKARLFVVEQDGAVVGTLQIAILTGLSLRAPRRAQIEAVRVRADKRGRGIGARMLALAVEAARAEGCSLVQLMANRKRVDAARFYERAGFVPSHSGFRRYLDGDS